MLQRAISLKPDAAAWHYRLAKIYQGEHDSAALAHFQRAQELDPANPAYAADLARTLAHDGDLATAADLYRRGGLYWVPTANPGTYVPQTSYVPNVVATQRPQTSYVARVVTEKRPIEVTSYQDEVVNEKVPVRTCRIEQTEEVP